MARQGLTASLAIVATLAAGIASSYGGISAGVKIYERGTNTEAELIRAGKQYDVEVMLDTRSQPETAFKQAIWGLNATGGVSVVSAEPASHDKFLLNDFFKWASMHSNDLLTRINTSILSEENFRTAASGFPSNREGALARYGIFVDEGLAGGTITIDSQKSWADFRTMRVKDVNGVNYKESLGNLYFTPATARVTLKQDVDGDGEVSVLDIVGVVTRFGATPGSPNWNTHTDIDQDEDISVLDIVDVVTHFGDTVSLPQ